MEIQQVNCKFPVKYRQEMKGLILKNKEIGSYCLYSRNIFYHFSSYTEWTNFLWYFPMLICWLWLIKVIYLVQILFSFDCIRRHYHDCTFFHCFCSLWTLCLYQRRALLWCKNEQWQYAECPESWIICLWGNSNDQSRCLLPYGRYRVFYFIV